MTHQQIQDNEIIEQYVRHKLPPAERLAFQEHFFDCDECFQQTTLAARFVSGVRGAAESGVLAARPHSYEGSASSMRFGLLRPILAFSVAVAVLFAVTLGWLWFSYIPKLRNEIAQERQSRLELEQSNQRNLENTRQQLQEKERQLETERAAQANLKDNLGATPGKDRERPSTNLIARASVPMVTLESTRDSQSGGNQISVPMQAEKFLLRVEVEPGNRFSSFTLEVLTKSNSPLETINAAKANRYGALTVSVPTSRLGAGDYLVKLYGRKGSKRELLGEYDLRVVRK